MINLNYTHEPEYNLYDNLTYELINGYGLKVKYIVTEKVNIDDTIFGEYTALKANNTDVFEIFLMPENSEAWNGESILFDQFGLQNYNTMNFFMSEKDLHLIFPDWESSIGLNDMNNDLILLPSGKVLEITHVELFTLGINNLYAFDDNKNVIKLVTRNYEFKQNDEITVDTSLPLSVPEEEMKENLDKYFTELLEEGPIPDENYSAENGDTRILKYFIEHRDLISFSDGLTINGITVDAPNIQNVEYNMNEHSESQKHKQDSEPRVPRKYIYKENEFSNPFGELG